MNNQNIDYHIHSDNIENAKLHIKLLSHEKQKNNLDRVEISFSEHEFNICDDYPLVDYGSRFGIDIIPAITLLSSDKKEFSIINPKKNIILEKIKQSRLNRLIHILNDLHTYDIYIGPELLMDITNVTEYEDLYRIKDKDILQGIVNKGDCENIEEAFTYLDNINIPKRYPDSKDIIETPTEETIYLIDPDNNIYKETNILENINGFIIQSSRKISKKFKEVCEQYRLDVKIGSGKLIS